MRERLLRVLLLLLALLAWSAAAQAVCTTSPCIYKIAASKDDSYVSNGFSGVYPPATSPHCDAGADTDAQVFTMNEANLPTYGYLINNSLLQWDTSDLPDDATVTNATVTFRTGSIDNADNKTLTCDYFNWGGTAGCTAGAYSAAVGSPIALTAKALSAFTPNASNQQITLENVSNISLTGRTYLRCFLDAAVPSGYTVFRVRSFNDPTYGNGGTQEQATLTVTWFQGAPPATSTATSPPTSTPTNTPVTTPTARPTVTTGVPCTPSTAWTPGVGATPCMNSCQ